MALTMMLDEDTRQLIPMYDGLSVSNEVFKIRDGFEDIDSDLWEVVAGNGDLIEVGGNTAGSSYLKISKSTAIEDTETMFLSKFIVKSPFRIGLGMSLSQRIAHQRFSIEFVGVDEEGNVINTVNPGSIVTLASVSQTTTTLTVVTQTAHGFVPGDRIMVYGVSDSRANYGEVLVATIIDSLSFTVTATPFATLPSQTISAITNSGLVAKVDPLNLSDNGIGIFWEGTSANNAKMISRSSKGALFNTTDTSLGTGHTNATVSNTNAYADAFNPAFTYDIRFKAEGIIARTFPQDSMSTHGGIIKRTQSVPDVTAGYKILLKARNNKSMSRVVADVASASKSGSTTVTITTNAPHGLAVGDYVMIYGIRDQVNFANLTTATAIASVVNATTFTIVLGASATATSYGGVVIKINGTYASSPANSAIQSISRTNGLMTITGNLTWVGGFIVGETIDLMGLYDTSGVHYPQYEGTFKVASISTTTVILYAPGTDFASINCGGAIVKRTDFRLHLLRVLDYTRHTVELDGSSGNHTDYQEALPVNVLNSITLTGGQSNHDSAISGAPVRIGGRALTANYSAVATGETADLVTTLVGAVITKPFSIPEADWQYTGSAIVNTTDVVLRVATASVKNYLTAIQIKNTHATIATEVVVKDGSTVIWRGYAPANMSLTDTITFITPIKGTVNTALNFACITTGANVYVNAQGYQAP